MTALGKMLVFLVLLLSLVFNGLVVNAYVTRTNWKHVADENKATAQNAASAVQAMESLLESERAAAAEALRRAREERYQYEELYTKEKNAGEGLRSTLDVSMSAARKDSATQVAAQALVDSLQKQVDNLTKDLTSMRGDNDQLVTTTEQATIAQTKAEIEAAAQQARADQLEDQLRKANDLISRLKRGGGAVNPLGEGMAAAPDSFRGTVRAYKDGYVAFTPGLDAGLRKGATLDVYRLLPEPKYLGQVVVVQVDPKDAVGRFIPAGGAGAGATALPKLGDEVKAD